MKQPMRGDRKAAARESLQSLLLFLIPVLLAIPLYFSGILRGLTAYYAVYAVYIAGSIVLTRRNGRGLPEIGLTTRNLPESLLTACVLPLARLVVRLRAGAHIAPGLTLATFSEQGLYNFVFSGLGQEILFRGLVLFSIWRWKGPKVAVLVSTVLFGLMHARMGAGYMLGTALIGGFYGYVAYRTENIVGPIVAHGLYNFLFDFLLSS